MKTALLLLCIASGALALISGFNRDPTAAFCFCVVSTIFYGLWDIRREHEERKRLISKWQMPTEADKRKIRDLEEFD